MLGLERPAEPDDDWTRAFASAGATGLAAASRGSDVLRTGVEVVAFGVAACVDVLAAAFGVAACVDVLAVAVGVGLFEGPVWVDTSADGVLGLREAGSLWPD